jgi:membrane protein YdbS with pleckstrin-like domain
MKPSWRKPFGVLALCAALAIYAMLAATLLEPVGRWPVLAQALVYVVVGTVWILPLGRFLQWMETGRFR